MRTSILMCDSFLGSCDFSGLVSPILHQKKEYRSLKISAYSSQNQTFLLTHSDAVQESLHSPTV